MYVSVLFLGPEHDKKDQFLSPETDNYIQFLASEQGKMGQQNFWSQNVSVSGARTIFYGRVELYRMDSLSDIATSSDTDRS